MGFLMEMDCLLAKAWVRHAEINLLLLCLSLELPVSTHPSRRRRSPPFGSCKFFGVLHKIEKRGSVANSTLDSNLVDSALVKCQLKVLLAEPICLQGLPLFLVKLKPDLNLCTGFVLLNEKDHEYPGRATYIHSLSVLIKGCLQKVLVSRS